MLAQKLLAATGGAEETLYVDDVFSAYTYTGNGSTQTITNGIDLAGKGGMVWIKGRSNAEEHAIFDTNRGASGNDLLQSQAISAAIAEGGFTAFNANGFSLAVPTAVGVNNNARTYASWTFRKAAKFFSQSTATVTGGVDATVSFSDLATLGMVVVKRTDSNGSWYVWHRSATAGKLLYLEQTAAEATLSHITVSGTTVTLEGGVIADGTYIVYAWAHDSSTDGIVQCGTLTGNGGRVSVTLGWEPQMILLKPSGSVGNWEMYDTSRGLSVAGSWQLLYPNTSGAEVAAGNLGALTATGFAYDGAGASNVFIYLAIRRPNKPPTVGTQVYQAIARTGTGAAATVTGVGFAPDLGIFSERGALNGTGKTWIDRLRGLQQFWSTQTTQELACQAVGFLGYTMDGFSAGTDGSGGYVNYNANPYIDWFFKRAPGVFDEVCYTGTGVAKTEAHSLGVVPELMIMKGRSGATSWQVYSSALANTEKLVLETTAAKATDATAWNSTTPTSSVFTIGTQAAVNTSTATYVCYLFATKAGISKVGSYTGNATTNTINCGFTTGARFVLIKRTDSTGDWYVLDTVRGIIAGNDPYLLLNSTAAEVTSTDYIDPVSTGFELSSTAPAAINASGGSFIYLAFA